MYIIIEILNSLLSIQQLKFETQTQTMTNQSVLSVPTYIIWFTSIGYYGMLISINHQILMFMH